MDINFKHSYIASEKESISLSVYNVGYQKCSSLYQWGPGIRDHYLIHHVISGQGYYTAENQTYSIKTGDTFIVYPYTEVFYYADEKNPWEYYWAGFAGSDAKFLLGFTDFSEESPVISTDFGEELKNAFLNIYNCRGQNNADIVKMTGQLYLALGLLIDKSSKKQNKNSNLFYAQKAAEYITYNYSSPISIEDIAHYVRISRSHLYKIFMSHYGVSPKEYLSDFRIKQACMLLQNTSLSIGAIANSVGFENNLYFSKVFHKAKGITPTDYIKKHKGTSQ